MKKPRREQPLDHTKNNQHQNHCLRLIELGLNDTSTLVSHFVSSPRKREKRDRRACRGDEREQQGRKGNRNESEKKKKKKKKKTE